MRLIPRLVAGILTSAAVVAYGVVAYGAQRGQPSSSSSDAAESPAKDVPVSSLPVSLVHIREALKQAPAEPLRGLHEQAAHFKVEIQERQRIEELLATLHFKSGPVVAGGPYGYEQQRLMFPSVDNPLRQPYAAFNQPELLTILIENLVGKYLLGRAINRVTSAGRARAEQAARDEVRLAAAEYCAAQPSAGAGILLCAISPGLR